MKPLWTILFAAVLVAAPCFAQEQRIPIEITADGENRFEGGIAYAEGNVVIRYGEDTLYADEVTFDREKRIITAKGNVSVYTRGKIYRGEFIEYYVDTQQVNSLDFRTVQGRFYLMGDKIDAPRSNYYKITNGAFTTENREDPSYRLKASSIEYYPGDWVVMKNIGVYIGPVPVMWLPYAAIPLGGDISTLEFAMGSTTRWGVYALAGYTTALDNRWSTTVHGGYYTRRGAGGGVDFTFDPGQNKTEDFKYGEIKSFYIHDYGTGIGLDDPNRTSRPPVDRYRVAYKHNYQLSDDFYTLADVNVWSDQYVTEDFFPDEYRDERQPDNYVDAMYYNQNFTATLLGRAQANNLFEVSERKPEFLVEFKRQSFLGTPLTYEGQSSVVNFEKQFDRDAGGTNYSANRYDSFHQLLYPRQYFGWLSVTPRAGVRATIYNKSNEPAIGPSEQIDRYAFNLGLESSFKLSRTWSDAQDPEWAIDGIRHVMQPYVNASYIPTPNHTPDDFRGFDDRYPSTRLAPIDSAFNSIDSIDRLTAVRHGIRNRIQTKRDGENVDLFSWDLYTQANITRSREMGILVDDLYSSVYNEVTIGLFPWLRYDLYSALPLSSNSFFEVDHSLTWQIHPAVDFILSQRYLDGVKYTSSYYPGGIFDPEDSNQFSVGTFWRLSESWKVSEQTTFEADTGQWEEQSVTLYRDLRSWNASISAAYREQEQEQDEFLVYMGFTLKAFPDATLTIDN